MSASFMTAERSTKFDVVDNLGSAHFMGEWFSAASFLEARSHAILSRHPCAAELLRPVRFDRDANESLCDALIKRIEYSVSDSQVCITILGPYFDRFYTLTVEETIEMWFPHRLDLGDSVRRIIIDCVDDELAGRLDFKLGAKLLWISKSLAFSERKLPRPLSRTEGLKWNGDVEKLSQLTSGRT